MASYLKANGFGLSPQKKKKEGGFKVMFDYILPLHSEKWLLLCVVPKDYQSLKKIWEMSF